MTDNLPARHDAYATDYDDQVRVYGAYLAEVLFGLVYEAIQPGQRLLDLGIGSGLSAVLFAKAGLDVYGMDFSPAMLDICRAKGIAVDLRQQDLLQTPWPYATESFDHAVCCGVFHFIDRLEPVFAETGRVLKPGSLFAYTIKSPASAIGPEQFYEQFASDGLDIFAHSGGYVASLVERSGFEPQKGLRCFVGDDIFWARVARKKI